MSNDPDDPRNIGQGLAAGSSGGKFGFMSVAMSDKAAKEFHGATKEINNASKTGALKEWIALGTVMQGLTQSGSLRVLMDFFELFLAFVEAGGAENMKAMAEILFSEESVEIARELGMIIGETNDSLLVITRTIRDFSQAIGFNAKVIKENREEIKILTRIIMSMISPVHLAAEVIKLFGVAIIEYTKIMEDRVKFIIELYESMPTTRLGDRSDDDDDDDDDTWWNPFD